MCFCVNLVLDGDISRRNEIQSSLTSCDTKKPWICWKSWYVFVRSVTTVGVCSYVYVDSYQVLVSVTHLPIYLMSCLGIACNIILSKCLVVHLLQLSLLWFGVGCFRLLSWVWAAVIWLGVFLGVYLILYFITLFLFYYFFNFVWYFFNFFRVPCVRTYDK